jgi:metal-responsive CopG/Arc/MetJ family transcriptional regulator
MNRMTEPRKRSGFIAEAVRQKIEQKEKEEMEKLLVEDYQAAAVESHALIREFESADLEGWEDY